MRGGFRMGSGRKPKTEEEKIQRQSLKAIKQTYGSVDKGFMQLLASKEPSLIRFVWEHAIGKPKEKLEIDSIQVEPIIGMCFKNADTSDKIIEGNQNQ